MFLKKQRLSKKEFDNVFKTGKTLRDKGFLLKYKENELRYPRFSVVISKKQQKNAVSRNFYKRKFYLIIKETKLKKINYDFIFILNKDVFEESKKEIILNIDKLRLK